MPNLWKVWRAPPRLARLGCATIVALCMATPAARAISMDKTSSMRDYCQAFLGADAVQMWGYLPDAPSHQYCEEIPAAGPAILTFDLLTPALRELPIEVRIVRAPITPINDDTDLAPIAVAHLDARLYPAGVITVSHDFTESGVYLALVTSLEPSTGERKTARFSFNVGRSWVSFLPILLGAVFIAGLVAAYWRHAGSLAKR